LIFLDILPYSEWKAESSEESMGLVGRLEDLGISDIFQILSIGKKTGTLVINSPKGTTLIGFRDGLVMKAETSVFEQTLIEELVAADVVKESALKLARDVQKSLPDKPLLEMLLELDALKKDTLEKSARKRIERVICEVMQWSEGDFMFELEEESANGKDPQLKDFGWKLTKGLSPEYLLMEGARVQDESSQGIVTEEESAFSADEFGTEEGGGWDEDWGGGDAPRKDISSLKALTQELRFPNSTSEITLLILRFASDIFHRGVLFMAGPDEIAGLGQFGLELENADAKIREIIISLDKSPFFAEVIKLARTHKGPLGKDAGTEFFISGIGGSWPSEAALFPLVAEGRVVALLYCDNPGDDPLPQSEGLEIFISHAGLALEKALLQRKLIEIEKNK
jgi:hypothetical protein